MTLEDFVSQPGNQGGLSVKGADADFVRNLGRLGVFFSSHFYISYVKEHTFSFLQVCYCWCCKSGVLQSLVSPLIILQQGPMLLFLHVGTGHSRLSAKALDI